MLRPRWPVLVERGLAPTTRRVYDLTLDALADALGQDAALSEVTGEQLAEHLTTGYGAATPATFNRHRPTRHARSLTPTSTHSGAARTLPRARSCSGGSSTRPPLGLNIEDLDLPERSGRITGKGGHVERIYWANGTARQLPRHLGDRATGPPLLGERAPRIAVATVDLDPVTGYARLSYRRAAEQFAEASGGRTLHRLRHSALTHLAEEGVDRALLKAKSRHQPLRSLERYVRPSEASVARLTADHDRARRR